jgi:hypothetical protein
MPALLDREDCRVEEAPAFDPLPLRLVPDWEEQVAKATEVCKLIDQHTDYEAAGRLCYDAHDFEVKHLCPEQKVSMVTDVVGMVVQPKRKKFLGLF